MSDIRRLLEKMDSMSSAEKNPAGPKFPGYWKGDDPASKAKNKMVGSAEESIIKELHKASKSKSTEWELNEDWKQFKEQDTDQLKTTADVSKLNKDIAAPTGIAPTEPPTVTPPKSVTPAPAVSAAPSTAAAADILPTAPTAGFTKPAAIAPVAPTKIEKLPAGAVTVTPGGAAMYPQRKPTIATTAAVPAPTIATPTKTGTTAGADFSKQIKDVAAASGIKDPNLILPGQKIKLPGGGEHIVTKGETLSGILSGGKKGDRATDVLPSSVPTGFTKPAAISTPGTSTAGAGRGVQGGATADELAAAGKATVTKSVTEPEPAKTAAPAVAPVAPAAPAAPTKTEPAYTGIDPIVRQRLGMAPATPAEIDAFKKANPPTLKTGTGGTVTTGSGTPVQAGGLVDVEKAAAAAADTNYSSVNRAISGAESGANPDISFGDRVDPKTGKITNMGVKDPATGKIVKLITPEEFAGKKLSDMTIGEVQAFQAARNKQLPGSSAVGQYQFVAGTLNDYVKRLNLDTSAPFSTETQQRLQNELLSDNKKYLQQQGINPTATNLYLAHVAGRGGAAEIYRATQTNPDAPAADVLAQQFAQQKKFAGDPAKQQAAFTAKRDQLIRLNPFLAEPVKDMEKILATKLTKGTLAKVSESIDTFVEDFKNFINGTGKPIGQSFHKMLRRINKDEQVTEFQNRQSPDAQITSPPAPAATRASQFTADMDIMGDEQPTMEQSLAGAQDPGQQTTSPASPVKAAVTQQQAAQKKVQDERQDLQTALGTVSSIKPYLSPKTDVNQVASAITKISNNQPLTAPESQAVSSLTPLIMKAAETPTSAAALKTALVTAGTLAKQGK